MSDKYQLTAEYWTVHEESGAAISPHIYSLEFARDWRDRYGEGHWIQHTTVTSVTETEVVQ